MSELETPTILTRRLPFRGAIIGSDGIKRQKDFNVTILEASKEMVAKVKSVDNNLLRGEKSNEVPIPEEDKRYWNEDVIEPPYDQLELVQLEEVSNILRECIDSMVVNIDGFGFYFRPRKMTEDEFNKNEKEINKEEVMLSTMFKYICQDISFTECRKKLRRDLELTGNSYMEVIRNKDGSISELNHIPSYMMRLVKADEKFTEYTMNVVRPDKNFSIETIKRRKKFRKYVQLDSNSQPVVYFKEYGDPRQIRKDDGEVSKGKFSNKTANELIHFRIYSPKSNYGIPRYIGRIVSIYGSRKSEEINYFTLDNNIPSAFIMVENGSLSEGSIQRLNQLIEAQVSGNPNFSKFVILEAEADMNEILPGQVGASKMTIKSMVETQRTDQMFQDYDLNNQNKIRQAFRLPPIFVGRAEDYTRATAFESRKLADEQIFSPERSVFDDLMTRIIQDMGVKFHEFRSRTPNVTDNESLIQAMRFAELSGGMTPRRAVKLMEDIFEGDLGLAPKGIDLDVPYSMQFAQAQNGMVSPGGGNPKAPGEQPDDDDEDRDEKRAVRWVRAWVTDAYRKD
ncbi:MAG: phage portal protein [Candidatus Peribacteraceae bacterium]|nr:phage portal protein [Candidatus Peribacteraceae bacterium]